MCRDLIAKIVTLLKSIATGIGNVTGDASSALETAQTALEAAQTADGKAVTADEKAVTADGKAVAADEKATSAKNYTDAVSNDTSLTAGTDLDTLTSTITYRVGNMGGMTNAPTGAGTTGILKIEKYDGYILQTFIGNTAIKYRYSFDNATTWGAWT